MSAIVAPAPLDHLHASLDTSTRLALERTFLASERTLMAWTRTATSLVTFGFTVYKFFEFLAQSGTSDARPPLLERMLFGPRQFAMLMIAIGTAALILATVQHWRILESLKKTCDSVPFSISALVAGLISCLGALALVAVVFQL